MKFLFSMVLGAVVASVSFGADFSKLSNEELANLAGKIEPKDALDFKLEIQKRSEGLSKEAAHEFRQSIRQKAELVYSEMKVKDFKARKEAMREAIKEQCQNDPKKCEGLKKHFKGDFKKPHGKHEKDKKEHKGKPEPKK